MANKEFHQLEKLLLYSQSKNRMSIKDNDLQINIEAKEAIQIKAKISFKKIYSQFLFEAENTKTARPSRSRKRRESPKAAMDAAHNAYETMMQIHKQLNHAYKEFIKMKS